VIEATGSSREAASVLFDLPGYRVIEAVDRPGQLRQVIITGIAAEAPCPAAESRPSTTPSTRPAWAPG
jgi:hypothetical protein